MPTLKNRSRSSTTASSASPASARAKENAGNSMSPADSESGSSSAAAAAALAASATGKRKSRAAAQISDLDRTADTQAGVEAMLDLHGGGDDSADEEKKDDGGGEAEEEESARKKPRRVRGGAKSAKKKKGKLHRTASDLLDESDDEDGGDDSDDFVQQDDEEEDELDAKMDYDEDAVEADDAPASPEPKARKKKSSKKKSKMEALPPITSPLTAHNHNDPGKPAEAGVIRRVYVENFMCHRKLTVDLCRNVNFIYGQNGSGKSAILAAIQICLGAGARRTHRATNLKELVRKEAGSNCNGAKVRVTVLNRGDDGYQHDVYGDSITIERSISLRGGYNGYKLLDEHGAEKSRNKKDLDAMLDQLNIQVENPVAVLDQEEAKKFLCGKPEDKYNFFTKATELERMDRAYANLTDNIADMSTAAGRILETLKPKEDLVKKLKHEYDQFKELDKLEAEVGELRVSAVWAKRNEMQTKADEAQETFEKFEQKLEKAKEGLEKAKADADVTDDKEETLRANLEKLSKEAEEAKATKEEREEELKEVEAPSRKIHKELAHMKKEEQRAEKALKNTKRNLQKARDEIAAAAGNRESEARSRIERKEQAERKLAEAKDMERAAARLVQDNFDKYEEVAPKLVQAKEDTNATESSFNTTRHRLSDLKKNDGNKLSVYGQKTVDMCRKIDEGRRRRQFQGQVIGPIGLHVKIKPGEEQFAGIAELALGSANLGRFIVTEDADRATLMRFRRELGCNTRECNVYQIAPAQRYRLRPSPSPDVKLVCEVLDIENDLVLNCLVDFCRIDSIALAESKEISERALLISDPNNPNKEAIRQPVKQVLFLPNGDTWKVTKGSRQMISNENRPRRTIGVDQSAAIREVENDIRLLEDEVDQKRQAEANLKKEEHLYKKRWNDEKKKREKLLKSIETAEATIEEMNDENDANEDVEADTTAEEEDVKTAEDALEEVQSRYEEKKNAKEEMWPAIEEAKKRLDEVTTRNEKVLEEIEQAENELEKYAQGHAKLQANAEKRRKKLGQIEEIFEKQKVDVAEAASKVEEWTANARRLAFDIQEEKSQKEAQEKGEQYDPREPADEDLEKIEPEKTKKNLDYYQAKIVQKEKKIEKEKQKRALTETDPEVAFMKYMRAKKDLDDKVEQLESIRGTIQDLTDDARNRRKRWRQFRSHIEQTTGAIFDEILNKKGSSGTLEFDHQGGTLNLAVQKDAANEMSQTKDVKALSGGERSFTTLALLLALGENLETPFRVMDEFDVFLDPVSRKIALQTMINVAKEMEHRQFIFITPQDLSSIKTDSKLKIFQMKNPKRGNIGGAQQQTLAFESPN